MFLDSPNDDVYAVRRRKIATTTKKIKTKVRAPMNMICFFLFLVAGAEQQEEPW